MKGKFNNYIISVMVGSFFGFLVPTAFIAINHEAKSYPLYIFSYISFPIIFSFISFFVAKLALKKKIIFDNYSNFQKVMNNIPDAIIVFSKETKNIIFANHTARETFPCLEIIPKMILDKYPAVAHANDELKNAEFDLPTQEDCMKSFLVGVNVIQMSKNDKQYVISLKNVQELREKELIIEEQKMLMVESSKFTALGEMASGFAHEINNPLTVVLGNLSILQGLLKKNKYDPRKFSYSINKCVDNVTRITSTIRSLQNLAGSKVAISDFPIMELRENLESVIKLRQEKEIFAYDFKFSDKNLMLNASLSQVSQAISYVVNNAIDACTNYDQSWISVEFVKDSHKCKILIIDSGNGIPRNMNHKIFNPMYTTKPVGKGTGIGLSVARSLITSNNGRIYVDHSHPNTCFVIELPLAKGQEKQEVINLSA